ncbi:MAG: chromosome partitioning protein ParB [Bacteroidota bacterium]
MPFQNQWLETALQCCTQAEIEAWVHRFLLGEGNNQALSDGLQLIPRFWTGPVQMSLGLMTRCCGPEQEMPFQLPAEDWEQNMEEKAASWRAGWRPPPFILSVDGTQFIVADGNHRHEMLRRVGEKQHWAFIWNDSETLWQQTRTRLRNLDLLPRG